MATRQKKPTPAQLLQQRVAQIERAYTSRIRSRMTRVQRAALDAERDRQMMLASREYARGIAAVKKKVVKKPARRRVSHAKKASRFWKHFAQDGTPVPPWEIEVGPGRDIEDQTTAIDESLFVDEDYDYEDFDTDWGGYEYEDTGYPDENS